MKNYLRTIHGWINRKLFDSKERVIQMIRILSLLVLLAVTGGVVYYYGFPKTETSEAVNTLIVRASLVFFLIRFLIVMIYDLHPLQFLRKRWLDGVLILLFSANAIAPVLFDEFFFLTLWRDFLRITACLFFISIF